MGIFKRYNELKNNYDVVVRRNKDLYERDIEHQKKYQEQIKIKNEEIAKLKIELEDTKGFLEQEKQCSAALRKERTNLKRELTKLKNKMNGDENGE